VRVNVPGRAKFSDPRPVGGLRPRISGTLPVDCSTKELDMIALGLILLIIGLVAGIGVLTTIGVILLVIGLILNLVPIGGSTRRVW
jgi:hypothetical protein